MKRLMLIIFLVISFGCAHSKKSQLRSKWYPLSKAEDIVCSIWPLRPKDISIDQITVIDAHTGSFLVKGISRNTKPFYYSFSLSEDFVIDTHNFVELEVPRDAVVIGGFNAFGSLYVVLAKKIVNGSELVIRSLDSNVEVYSLFLDQKNIVEGVLVSGSTGSWIALRDDNGISHLSYISFHAKDKFQANQIQEAETELPRLASFDGKMLALWRNDQNPWIFQGKWFSEVPGKVPTALASVELPLEKSEEVESWSIGSSQNGFYLSVILGDSLLGEASLKVGHVKFGSDISTVSWTQSVSLQDIHVTEPLVLNTGNGPEVMFMNWVDEESTIARYIIGADNLSKPRFSGVFKNGTRLLNYGKLSASDLVWILTRHRNENRWVFQICGL